MPIPCGACGDAVHETAVKCPHCGKATGVAAKTEFTAAERAAQIELIQRANQTNDAEQIRAETAARRHGLYSSSSSPLVELVVGVAKLIDVMSKDNEHIAADDEPPTSELPRAVARVRSRPPTIEPVASAEPEAIEPATDKPRFLK
jgi:uncharacterized Zn finger protein (UPF0148 family)